jgi:hypothetical protein
MIVSLRVKFCELMRDSRDFLIFGVEVGTAYTSSILAKRFEDFERFHLQISYFWNQEIDDISFGNFIPKLPGYILDPPVMKVRMEAYVSGLMDIIQNSKFHKFMPWIKIIHRFLKVRDIEKDEETKASKIQGLYKEFCARKSKSRNTGLLGIENKLLQRILAYLNSEDLQKISRVSKRFQKHSNQIFLIRNIQQQKQICKSFRTLDLSFCESVTGSILRNLFQICTPELLEYLNLEGCLNLSDKSFKILEKYQNSNPFILSDLNLSSCNLTDKSIPYLQIFKNLKNLNLSKNNLTQGSSSLICLYFPCLETLDLSCTSIQSESLSHFTNSRLKTLIIKDCKNLETSSNLKKTSIKIISSFNDFIISLIHKSSNQAIHIKGNNSIQVRDLSSFISKKIATNSEVLIKYQGKELKKYLMLVSLPQENGVVSLTFEIIPEIWQGLPVWTEKKSVKNCSKCLKKFSWFSRKINCRMCGEVFCETCCKNKDFIEKYGYTLEKVPVCCNCLRPHRAI